MSGQTYEFGIRFTSDSRVAVTEAGKVQAAQEGIKQSAGAAAQQVNNLGNALGNLGDGGQGGTPPSPALKSTAADLEKVGVSAKQTAAALRNVPAQMTDIVTQLAAGQAPLQVLIQQGGQLKDMFGGIGPAARALGGYIVGMINPLTVAAAGVGALALAYYQGSKESEAYTRSIIMTGNAAGTSTAQLRMLASSVATASNATQGAAAEALAQAVATGRIASENLGMVAEAAIKMERATGAAISDSVAQFAELGKSPVAASLKLTEQYNYLTVAVYREIKAREEQGKLDEAADIAQEAYGKAMKERADKLVSNLGYIEGAWKAAGREAKKFWDYALAVGREDDPLKAAQAEVDRIKAKLADASKPSNVAYNPGGMAAEQARLKQVLFFAELARDAEITKAAAAERTTKAETATNEQNKKAIEFWEEAGKHQSQAQQRANALAQEGGRYTAAVAQAKGNAAELEKIETAHLQNVRKIRQQFSTEDQQLSQAAIDGQLKRSQQAWKAYIENISALQKQAIIGDKQALDARLAAEENALKAALTAARQRAATAIGPAESKRAAEEIRTAEDAITEHQAQAATERAALAKQESDTLLSIRVEQLKKEGKLYEAAALEAQAKYSDEIKRAQLDGNAELAASYQSLPQAMTQQGAFDQAKQEYEALFAQLQSQLDAVRQAAERDGGLFAQIDAEQRAEAIKQQLLPQLDAALQKMKEFQGGSLVNDKAVSDSVNNVRKIAEQADPYWKKFTDDVRRSMTDSIMRGLEDGKPYAKVLRDAITNTFKVSPIKLAAEASVDLIMNMTRGAFGSGGYGGVPGQVSGGGFGGGFGSGGWSLMNAINNGNAGVYNAYNTFATSGAGQWLGLSSEGAQAGTSLMNWTPGSYGVQQTGLGQTVGQALPYLPSVMYAANGQWGSAAGSAIGAYFGGPIGAFVGGQLGGLLDGRGDDPHNNAQVNGYQFGLSRSGAYGVTSNDGVGGPSTVVAGPTSGSGWWADNSAMSAAQITALNQQTTALFASAEKIAQTLGVSASALDNVSISSTTDGTQNGHLSGYFTSIDQAMSALGDKIATAILPNIADFKLGTETLGQTLDRVVGNMQAVDAWGTRLGFTLSGLSDKNSLATAFGGAGNMNTALGAYFQDYYSQEERAARMGTELSASFAQLNVQMPTSKDGLRALISATVDSKDGWEQTYASLVALAPAFSQYQAALEGTGGAVSQASSGTQAYNRAMLEASGDSSGLSAFDRALENARLIAEGWTQSQIDNWRTTQDTTSAAAQTKAVTESYNRAMLEASGDSSGLSAFDRALENARLIAEGWTQSQIDNWRTTQATTSAAAQTKAVTESYNRAMLEASGDSSGLSAFDRALENARLIAEGWTQAQIDNWRTTQDTTSAAAQTQAVMESYNRAMLEASGDSSGLAAFDRALENSRLIAEGWTQAQIDNWRTTQATTQATATAASNAGTRQSWQDQLDILQGRTTQLQLDRARQLASAADDATRSIMRQVFAEQDLTSAASEQQRAQQAAADKAHAAAERMREDFTRLYESIVQYRSQLRLGEDSTLSPEAQLALAQQQYQSTLAHARLGDVTAGQQLTSVADAYIKEARDYYGSSQGYADIFKVVDTGLASVQAVAARKMGDNTTAPAIKAIADKLDKLDAVVGELQVANDLTSSVAQATISTLQAIRTSTDAGTRAAKRAA